MADTVFDSRPVDHRGRTYDIGYFVRPGSTQTVVYFHGLGSAKEDFLSATKVPELQELTLLGIDFPGCGSSSAYFPEIPLGIDDLIAVTFKLVTMLGFQDLTLIGQSLGGLTALQFACRHGDLVSRFVNVEGNLAPEDCEIQSRDVFRRRFLGDEDRFFLELHERLTASAKPGFAEFAENFRQNIADRAYFDYCRSIVDYSEGYPLFDQFVGLPIPKLFIHGQLNSHLSYLPRLVAAGIPVVSVPDSDHFPAATNPTFYYHAISGFIHGQPVGT
jgi:pimeloyl-ACP methyl ester carboxylesterase